MRGTFTLPDGSKVRSASQRRYVVVAHFPSHGYSPVKRSDTLSRLTGYAQHLRSVAPSRNPYIVDTHTGEVVR